MREPTENSREPHGFFVRASRAVLAYAMANWKSYAAAAGAGLFLALVAAFGMDSVPLWKRLAYWIPIMMIGAAAGHAIAAFATRRPQLGENRLLMWATISLLVTIPATPLVWLATSLMFGFPLDLATLFNFIGAVLPVSAAMTAITMLVNTPGPATHAPLAGAPAVKVRFLERLPAKIMGGVVWAVEAEDHYLRVRTSKGADLILMRLADAIVELDGIEGAQVHRSWWVARDGVADVKRDGPRVTLVLKDGSEAPVSRPNVKALREAGWW